MVETSLPKRSFNLAIVGGGISGLTLALTLLEYNVDLTIYEAAPHFGEIGAGVSLGPNAGRTMQRMSPKILDAFLKCKTGNVWESKKNSWFTIRVGDARRGDKDGYVRPGKKVDDELFNVELSPGESGGVYRAQFLDELVKDVPEGIAKFDKRLVDISDATDGSGDAVLHFADGSTAQHSAVIACDGIKSKAKQWLLGSDNTAAHPFFSGKYAYRGLIPMDQASELLGEEVAQNSQIFMGYHGHVLTFPIQDGKTMNGTHIPPSTHLPPPTLLTPPPSVVAFSSRETWDNDKWVVTTSKEDMQADFADWGGSVAKIIGAMQKPDLWALFMHPPCNTYTKGRVCLLGDAAHATTPHQGAGAGMCIEDAYVMATLIKDASTVHDVQRAFRAFEHVRKHRTQRLITTSKEAGMLYDLELLGDDLDRIEENFMTRMKWIWDIDLDGHVEEARRVYNEGTSAKI